MLVTTSGKEELGNPPLFHFAGLAKESILENAEGIAISAKFQGIKKKIAGGRNQQSASTVEKLDILDQTALSWSNQLTTRLNLQKDLPKRMQELFS